MRKIGDEKLLHTVFFCLKNTHLQQRQHFCSIQRAAQKACKQQYLPVQHSSSTKRQAAKAVSSRQHQQANVPSNLRSSILAAQATSPQREYRASFLVVLTTREGMGAAEITGAWRQGCARLEQQQQPQGVAAPVSALAAALA